MFSLMSIEFCAHFVKNCEFQGSQEEVIIKIKKKRYENLRCMAYSCEFKKWA